MSSFVRRLVSGNKARFQDGELDLELDLVYITDQVIVMGYPASGIEGFYRNKREDAIRFLEHRHGKNFWVFNFCPVKENSYPATVFEDRVSRYPFPDHHAPPLAILPLVAREMRVWLEGSPERVAVLHCKAGKGRSGTMACAYLLTLEDAPSPPQMQRNQNSKEWAKSRAEDVMNTIPADDNDSLGKKDQKDHLPAGNDSVERELADKADSPSPPSSGQEEMLPKNATNNLSHVLALHTSRRMRRSSSPSKEVKPGVSIPSQRRWLYYWSLLLANQAPPGFWPSKTEQASRPAPKVRLTQIKLRMHTLSGLKKGLVKAANALLDHTKLGGSARAAESSGQIWASLARYDDDLVDLLEQWERHTRDENGNMGRRRTGSEHMAGEALADVFKDGRWDKSKMVRSFARLGTVEDEAVQKEESQDGKIITQLLRPLTGDKWAVVKDEIEREEGRSNASVPSQGVESEEASLHDVTQTLTGDGGVVLNANREVRVKLYMGQVFMGWFWFIPTFHMPHPRASGEQSMTMVLTRKELDFPVGIGSGIVDLQVSMEWCPVSGDAVDPPTRAGSLESVQGLHEPAGTMAMLQAATAGDVGEMVEAKQAADD